MDGGTTWLEPLRVNDMNHKQEEKLKRRLLREVKEVIRLSNLSNEQLIVECIQSGLADDPRVSELMQRVLPDWQNNEMVDDLLTATNDDDVNKTW
jgi:hypothetical protein